MAGPKLAVPRAAFLEAQIQSVPRPCARGEPLGTPGAVHRPSCATVLAGATWQARECSRAVPKAPGSQGENCENSRCPEESPRSAEGARGELPLPFGPVCVPPIVEVVWIPWNAARSEKPGHPHHDTMLRSTWFLSDTAAPGGLPRLTQATPPTPGVPLSRAARERP